jgi:3-phenylpropionate/trans-cinnamate dioxygenase ferredoxin subunit
MITQSTMMASEIESGQMKVLHLHGVAVAIANVEGAFYAISDVCPHDGGSLSRGVLDGKTVTCPNDGSRFDLASGSVLSGPASARVRTYHVQVRDDEIRV